MPRPVVNLTVRIPVDLDRLLKEEDSRRGGRAKNQIVIEALRAYLSPEKWTPTNQLWCDKEERS